MIICPKCGKVISYNSYFKGYICNYCDYEKRDNEQMTSRKTFRIKLDGKVKNAKLAPLRKS